MTPEVPDPVTDPVGAAVALIACIEPRLGPAAIETAVTGVAGNGRAKRRSLACALCARPEILTDGRSPAPRVVGDLLIARRKAGTSVISPPACAGCGKDLRTLQRRGQDWYCGLRPPAGAMRILRPAADHRDLGPAGTAALQPLPRP
jgi:hypothetical protein